MEEYITLKKRNTLKIGIKDEEGVPKVDENGKELFIEFDLEDIDVLDNYNKCVIQVEKAHQALRNDMIIIGKKQDSKGKGFMTKNQELEKDAVKKYYAAMEKAINLFIGEGGVDKIFGKHRYLTMFDDFDEMIQPILPKLKVNLDSIDEKIKGKYKSKDTNVLRDE